MKHRFLRSFFRNFIRLLAIYLENIQRIDYLLNILQKLCISMASNQGLYHPSFERDACGIGFVANIKGHKSHQTISDALTVLENMEHRGACGCENNTGDGAGILIQTPHEFFFYECIKLGVHLPPFGKYGVGVIFFPREIRLREECREIFSRCAEKLGLEILAYRKVPVNPG